MRTILISVPAFVLAAAAVGACGGDESTADDPGLLVAAATSPTTSEPEAEQPSVPATTDQEAPEPEADRPLVMATTGIWADITANLACGGLAVVESVMEPGVDPHGYEPSMADRARMEEAALVVSNGLGLEEGLVDTLQAVADAGTPVFPIGDHIDTIEFASGDDHDDHADEDGHDADHDEDGHDDDHADHDEDGHEDDDADHDEGEHEDDHDEDDHADHDEDGHEDDDADHDEGEHEDDDADHDEDGHEDDDADHDEGEHADEDGHGHDGHAHDGADPHVWFDPVRVSEALDDLAQRLSADAGLDSAAVEACLNSYRADLSALHDEMVEILAAVGAADRKLVTNHDAFGYFADRYEFEVIGTVIPSTSTLGEPSPSALGELADLIADTGVRAVFAEEESSPDTIESLASRVGRPVTVATIRTGSLGQPGSGADTYAGFMRANARAIASALSSG